MRLLSVRHALHAAFESAISSSQSASTELDGMMDRDEFLILREMYALQEARSPLTRASSLARRSEKAGEVLRPSSRASLLEGSVSPALGLAQGETSNADIEGSPGRAGFKRLSLVGGSMRLGETASSPILDNYAHTTGPKRHSKHISILSDDIFRPPAGTGTPSSRRTSRIGYISSSDGAPTPNDSAASKRLSYVASAAVGPASPWTGGSGRVTPRMDDSAGTFAAFDAGTVSPYVGGVESHVATSKLEPTAPASMPLSIASLTQRHEDAHTARRLPLVKMLALRFDADEAYWQRASFVIGRMTEVFSKLRTDLDRVVQEELRPEEPVIKEDPTSAASKLQGHPGLEDRLHAMALMLRSMQLKMQSCATSLQVKPPPVMHGYRAADESAAALAIAEAEGDKSEWKATELVFESIRDDLLSFSAEWESGLSIFTKDRKQTASPNPSGKLTRSHSSPQGFGDFESPKESDEDAMGGGGPRDPADMLSTLAVLGETSAFDDSEIAALVRQSTDPTQLPPPGLEQVFESIATFANASGQNGGAAGMTREERIAKVKEQRAQRLLDAAADKAATRDTASSVDAGMMHELKDVIAQIKQKREPATQSSPPRAPSSGSAASPSAGFARPRVSRYSKDGTSAESRRRSSAIDGVVSGGMQVQSAVWEPEAMGDGRAVPGSSAGSAMPRERSSNDIASSLAAEIARQAASAGAAGRSRSGSVRSHDHGR